MSFSLLSVLILVITVMVIYREIKKGYRHGLSKSLINLSILIFCAVFTSLASMWIAKLLSKLIWLWMESSLSGMVLLFPELIGTLISIGVSILLYIPMFYALKAVLNSLSGIILCAGSRKLKKTQEFASPMYSSENVPLHVEKDKKLGALVGAISGIVISVVVFMPLMGCLKTTHKVIDVISESEIVKVNTESETFRVIDKYSNDASGTVLYYCGGNLIYDLTTRIYSYEYNTCLNREIESFRDTDFIEIAKELYSKNEFSKDNIEIFEALLDEVGDHVLLRLATTDIVKGLSSSWLEYEPFMGLGRPNFGHYAEIDSALNSAFMVCAHTTVEHYDADVRTMISLVSILNESSIFSEGRDYQRFMNEFVESDLIEQLEAELAKNPRMSPVQLAIDNLFIDMIASELNADKYADKRELFYREIATVLNNNKKLSGSVQKHSIKNGVSDAFENCGVYLPEALEERVADKISGNLLNNENLTEKTVESFFNQSTNLSEQD